LTSSTTAARIFCWTTALLIALGYTLCAVAIWDYRVRTDSTRGESLMVLPGVGLTLLFVGAVLLACIYRFRNSLGTTEKRLLTIVAALGLVLFPTVLAADVWFHG
jgi:hypothetical protein